MKFNILQKNKNIILKNSEQSMREIAIREQKEGTEWDDK